MTIQDSEVVSKNNDEVVIQIDANEVRRTQFNVATYTLKKLVPTYVSAGNFQTSPDGENGWTTIEVSADTPITVGMLRPYFRVTANATVTFFAL